MHHVPYTEIMSFRCRQNWQKHLHDQSKLKFMVKRSRVMFNMVCVVKRSEFIAKIIVCDYVTQSTPRRRFAWKIGNDIHTVVLWLRWKPSVIACSCG